MQGREGVHATLITERGWLVRTLMRIAWKASQSSGVKMSSVRRIFHRYREKV